ncbi:membrane protein [Bacillaceae bacterium JMAK1]|nr:membrane protein [Bacillaceae bacterium JMAK1]
MTVDDVSFAAGLFNLHENIALGFWLLYLTVVVLSIVVFNLGFARKLPLLKNIVVYAALLIGSLIIAFFGVFYPVVESLIVAGLILGIYRIRLRMHKRNKPQKEQTN